MNGPKKVCLIDKVSLDRLNLEIKCFISRIDSEINSEKKDMKMYKEFLDLEEAKNNHTNNDDNDLNRYFLYESEKKAHYKDLILEKKLKIKLLERHREIVEEIKKYLAEGVENDE